MADAGNGRTPTPRTSNALLALRAAAARMEADQREAAANGDGTNGRASSRPAAATRPPRKAPAAKTTAAKTTATKSAGTKPAAAKKAAPAKNTVTTKTAAARSRVPRPAPEPMPDGVVVDVPEQPADGPGAEQWAWGSQFDRTFGVKEAPPRRAEPAPPVAVAPPAPPPTAPYLPPASPASGGHGARNSRARNIVVGVVIGGLALAGIGTGVLLASGGSAPSVKEYVGKADKVCASGNALVAAIAKPTSYPEVATAGDTLASTTRAQLAQLNQLKHPSGSAGAAATAVLSSFDGTAQAAQQLRDAAAAKDDAATINATKALRTTSVDAATKAKAFGFATCGTALQTGAENVAGGAQGIIKSSFLAKADSLCRAAARSSDAIPEPSSNPSRTQVLRYMDAQLALFDKMVADLKALPVPPGDETTVSDMLAAADKVESKSHEERDAVANNDPAAFDAIDVELGPIVTASDAKFDAYGLGSCGSNFGVY